MDGSQDSTGTHPQSQGAPEPSPGGRSGEGADSAMRQMIADSERQQRVEPGAQDTRPRHPQ